MKAKIENLIYSIPVLLVLSVDNTLSAFQGRIVGGKDATDIKIPWQVSLVYYGAHHCGGSIISDNVIVTASHCLFGLNKRILKIRIGSKFRSSGGTLIAVEKWKTHEKFDMVSMESDIAVIFLKETIKFVPGEIEPIQLAEHKSEISHGSNATVSGWGKLTPDGGYSEILQYAVAPVIRHDICSFLYTGLISDNMLCAGYMKGGIDACQQDSGGPLVDQLTNKLIGVVSWGTYCARPQMPGVYTKISELRQWIDWAVLA